MDRDIPMSSTKTEKPRILRLVQTVNNAYEIYRKFYKDV